MKKNFCKQILIGNQNKKKCMLKNYSIKSSVVQITMKNNGKTLYTL